MLTAQSAGGCECRARGQEKGQDEDFHWEGLDYPREDWDEIMEVDREKWKREVILHEELFIELSEHLPKELLFERELLICRL